MYTIIMDILLEGDFNEYILRYKKQCDNGVNEFIRMI